MADIKDICIINDIDNVDAADPATAGNFTRFNFKVEQIKIPEFFGKKWEDTILSMDYILHTNDLTRTNNWSDTTTYYNFANYLRGMAQKWLISMVEMEENMTDQLRWTDFKDLFKEELAIESHDKFVIEGLSVLSLC
jgi:hypothetical protein